MWRALARGLQVGDERRLSGDATEAVECQVDTRGACHGDQVDGGVGRAARDHHEANGVLEGLR